MEAIEEAFSCYLILQLEVENPRIKWFKKELTGLFSGFTPEIQESALKVYLNLTASSVNNINMKKMFDFLVELVNSNVLPAR